MCGPLAAAGGFDEGADAEVDEDEGDADVEEEVHVLGAVERGGAGPPCVLAEEGCEEGEEEPGDLEPEGAGDVLERAEEGLAEAAGAFTDAASGVDVVFWRARGRWCGGAGLRRRGGRGLPSGGLGGGCGGGLGDALLGHARGDTDANAEFASEAVRLHEGSLLNADSASQVCGWARCSGLAIADEGVGGSVFGIDEDDVFGIASWGVDGEEDDRAFEEVRHCVNRVALEEEKVAGREFFAVGGALHPEGASAGEHVEMFVAVGVVVRRRWAVDTKDTGAGCCFVGQVGVQQQGLCRFGEVLSDPVQVESSKGLLRN